MTDDELPTCHCCGYSHENLIVTEYERSNPRFRGQKWLLCDLCAKTLTGTKADYAGTDSMESTMKTICFVGNTILTTVSEHFEILYNR